MRCCAGPILAVLAAIGLGTEVGLALFGVAAILLGAVAVTFVAVQRRHRSRTFVVPISTPVEFTRTPGR